MPSGNSGGQDPETPAGPGRSHAQATPASAQAPKTGGPAAQRFSKAAVEAATLVRLPKLLPDRTFHKRPNQDGEWIDDLGQRYDQMGSPNMIPHWDKQRAQFMAQIDAHLRKTQITVIDLTAFPQHIIDDVNAQLGTLRKQDLDRIIRVGF